MGVLTEGIEEDIGSVPACRECKSTRIVVDATVSFNSESGLWEIVDVLDSAFCEACGEQRDFDWMRLEPGGPNLKVRELNDTFRTTGRGNGQVVITQGIQALSEADIRAILQKVQQFDQFSEDNDPWGEHDFGAFDHDGQKIFWKMDCYNLDCIAGSENPANEAVTCRVLTIMLASEY